MMFASSRAAMICRNPLLAIRLLIVTQAKKMQNPKILYLTILARQLL